MPTTTNPTPAEIVRLEHATPEKWAQFCAQHVMGWKHAPEPFTYTRHDGQCVYVGQEYLAKFSGYPLWSPWNNPATALEVLDRLAKGGPYWIMRINSEDFEVGLGFPSDERGLWADAPGPHFGPAVCRLAEKVMEGR